MFIAAAVGIGSALIGYKSSKNTAKAASQQQKEMIEAQKMDPRVAAMIFGNGGDDPGLMGKYRGMLDTPQAAGINTFERANDLYLGQGANEDTNKLRSVAHGQINGGMNPAPQINSPAQNNVATQGAFDRFINGDAGANPYLNQSINGALAQSTNVFNQMQDSATENLKENILPGIRGNSVLAGQYGGSRQGIAEGNAIGDFAKAQQQAINQFGQNNTNAGVGAQSQSFNQGQDRSLAATTNLSGQQYGTAATNAGLTMQQQGMNDARTQVGAANLSGLIGSSYNTGQNYDSYALNRAGKVNGLLGPYMGNSNAGIQIPQPLYSNAAGSALSGGLAGVSLFNMFKNSPDKNGSTGNPLIGNPAVGGYGTGASAGGGGTYYDGTQWVRG